MESAGGRRHRKQSKLRWVWFVYPRSLALLDVSEDWSMLRNLAEYASLLCVPVCMHMCVHADRSEDNWAIASFPPLWVPLSQGSESFGLGSQCLYPLSHLASRRISFQHLMLGGL